MPSASSNSPPYTTPYNAVSNICSWFNRGFNLFPRGVTITALMLHYFSATGVEGTPLVKRSVSNISNQGDEKKDNSISPKSCSGLREEITNLQLANQRLREQCVSTTPHPFTPSQKKGPKITPCSELLPTPELTKEDILGVPGEDSECQVAALTLGQALLSKESGNSSEYCSKLHMAAKTSYPLATLELAIAVLTGSCSPLIPTNPTVAFYKFQDLSLCSNPRVSAPAYFMLALVADCYNLGLRSDMTKLELVAKYIVKAKELGSKDAIRWLNGNQLRLDNAFQQAKQSCQQKRTLNNGCTSYELKIKWYELGCVSAGVELAEELISGSRNVRKDPESGYRIFMELAESGSQFSYKKLFNLLEQRKNGVNFSGVDEQLAKDITKLLQKMIMSFMRV